MPRSSRLAGERRAAAAAGGASRGGGSPDGRGAVRAWAGAAGLKVCERGRISAGIMRQYDAAPRQRHIRRPGPGHAARDILTARQTRQAMSG